MTPPPSCAPTISPQLLDTVGAESADVFGSSGGAVTGLALVARHPGRVRTLVAHEPPLLELLPDAAAQRAKTEDIIATFHAEGIQAAWFKFMVNAGFDKAALEGAPMHGEQQEPSEQELREAALAAPGASCGERPSICPISTRSRRRGWWSALVRTRVTCSPTGPPPRCASGSAPSPSNSPAITADSSERHPEFADVLRKVLSSLRSSRERPRLYRDTPFSPSILRTVAPNERPLNGRRPPEPLVCIALRRTGVYPWAPNSEWLIRASACGQCPGHPSTSRPVVRSERPQNAAPYRPCRRANTGARAGNSADQHGEAGLDHVVDQRQALVEGDER